MSAISLGLSNYVRTLGKTPPILLINMFLEKDASNQIDGLVRLPRPGLAPFVSIGTGPSRGIFRQLGTFGGDWLAVSGTQLYRVTTAAVSTLLGAITGSTRVTFAASATRALIATGGTCYSTNGTTVTAIVMPAGENVSSVACINDYFILTVKGGQRFFWLAPGDVNPNALNFASVANSPDNIAGVRRLYDELWFLGDGSVEVWLTTGDLNAPFQRIAGRLYDKGCVNADTIATTDNTVFWVGSDLLVYRGSNQPIRISDHSIEEYLRLAGGANCSAWAFALDGHTFYVLRIGTLGTFIYDVENPSGWARWKSYGSEVWRACCGGQAGEVAQVLAGDDTTNNLWLLDPSRSNDNGSPMVREVMGGVPMPFGKGMPCKSFEVFVSTGWAPEIGAAANPVLELNWYDDGGEVLSGPWIPLSLGQTGQYGQRLTAYQLGQINPPGRIFHLRISDDVLCRISYARMNDAF